MIVKAPQMQTIIVQTSFEGCHRFANAPAEVAFLRQPHRHIFHVKVEMEVFHDDRELEFILVKRAIEDFVSSYDYDVNSSCEQLATSISNFLLGVYGDRKVICQVLEDGENGGCVYYGF